MKIQTIKYDDYGTMQEYTLDEFLEKAIDDSLFLNSDRGTIETLEADVRNLKSAFINLTSLLIEKETVSLNEAIESIWEYYDETGIKEIIYGED